MSLAVARSSVAAAEPTPWPADAVEVARVAGAWGVKGWVKVQPVADDPQALLHARHWHLQAGDRAIALTIIEARRHGAAVIASARELTDRDGAEALRGTRVFVSRASFPALGADEFYWRDLIGLAVVNREGIALGTVVGLLDTGAHSVLRVQPVQADAGERLIPFVGAYVDAVKLPARRIDVDWQPDY
jgi:16S rRNA processing protein RimM